MVEGPTRMRQGRQGLPAEERPAPPMEMDEDEAGHGFALETEEDRRLGEIEEWMIRADRRLERVEAKLDRLGAAIDQLNTQLGTVLAEMPTRKGINLYLVGGLIGGLAVGLAIMGITIGGIVGGLSSLKPEPATMAAPAYPMPQAQAPIIIQMPSGASVQPMAPQQLPSALPPQPAESQRHAP